MGEMQNAIAVIITVLIFYVVGAVAISQLEDAGLIAASSSLNGTIGTVSELYILVGGMLTLVIVVGMLVIVIRNVKAMGGAGNE
jgi:small-conductance mechanosensitive channel